MQAGCNSPACLKLLLNTIRRVTPVTRSFNLALLTLLVTASGAARAAEPEAAALIKPNAFWHYFMVSKTEEVRFAKGGVQPIRYVGRRRRMKMEKIATAERSELPPANWAAPDFDDASWPRRRLAISSPRRHSLICVRSRFLVGDPAKLGDATLTVSYRGGVVVYLNGEELTRSHMPTRSTGSGQAGKIGPDTPATDYSKEAYVAPDGFLLRMDRGDMGKYKDRFAKRNRALTDFRVPAAKLLKGVNTLALELHRPVTDEVLHTGKGRAGGKGPTQWVTIALGRVDLSASPAGLVAPSKDLVVNVLPTLQRLYVDDGCDVADMSRPIRISGVRNGAFSARMLISSAAAIKGLAVTASELKGAGVIPVSAVQVRYAQRNGPRLGGRSYRPTGPATYDGLAPEPPAAIAVAKGSGRAGQPVWITVNVPKDAKPGDYSGAVTVSATGVKEVKVPVTLTVAAWTLPEPRDFESWFGLAQSPETLARHYKVPMWSEKHWALIDRSFELMGQVGTRMVYIPLIRRSHFGNKHSMMRWIKKADGTWDHDFSIFEKYIDTALKRLRALDVIVLHCWGRRSGGAYMARGAKASPALPMFFTELDPKTGVLTEAKGPTWKSPDIGAFWKPVFDGIRERLAKRKCVGGMMLGIAHDTRPTKECVEMLAKASGGVPWVAATHPRTWSIHGQPVGYLAHVWGSPRPELAKKRRYGWKEKRFYATFPRFGSSTVLKLSETSPPVQYRVAFESAMVAGIKGYGWIGADFWPVATGGRRARSLLDYYLDYDSRGNLGISHAFGTILQPGRDGPVATVRHEATREGAQETEARVFIERALLDPARKAKLGEALAKKCQATLDKRLRDLVQCRPLWDALSWRGWEQQKAELFALAAEVALATEGGAALKD
jgi:glycosyl hydrolase family 123